MRMDIRKWGNCSALVLNSGLKGLNVSVDHQINVRVLTKVQVLESMLPVADTTLVLSEEL